MVDPPASIEIIKIGQTFVLCDYYDCLLSIFLMIISDIINENEAIIISLDIHCFSSRKKEGETDTYQLLKK